MPREPKAGSFVIASMQVEPPTQRQTWALIDHGMVVPTSFRVRFQLERPKFYVAMLITARTGKPVVERLEVTPGWLEQDGTISGVQDGITTTNLRQLLIDRLVRTAFEAVRRPAEMADEKDRLRLLSFGASEEQADALGRASFRVPGITHPNNLEYYQGPRPGRGRQTPQDRIAAAAGLYKRAVAAGSVAPVKDVGIALGYSTSQASRYLKAAREQGLLADVEHPEKSPETSRDPSGLEKLTPEQLAFALNLYMTYVHEHGPESPVWPKNERS